MALQKWKDFLINGDNNAGKWALNLFDGSSYFFSAPMIFDIYGRNAIKDNLELVNLQEFFNHNTVDAILNINNIAKQSTSLNGGLITTMFSDETAETLNLFGLTSLNDVSVSLMTSMKQITLAKTDVESMRWVLFDFKDEVEMFEIMSDRENLPIYESLSTPDFKLYYPEPFIASPSFVHEDLWFIHILHYQHWLWFMFISLIMFYFVTFINVVRWCNLRTKPKRETRGVSRSKCADLITACVPVSWAISIIISETVDATDYYDGFGTGEIVIGIRAYQWGWEYFYPKGIDLNYNVNPSYSSMVGNSLKYTNTSSNTLNANTLWKYYQSKSVNKLSSTPAHLLLNPTGNSNLMNFMNFNDVGSNISSDSTAFKKIQYFSKTNPQSLFNNSSEYSLRYDKLANLYFNDIEANKASSYGTLRQHNYTSSKALTNGFSSKMENKNIDKFLEYNTSFNKQNSNKSSKYFNDFSSSNTYSRHSELNSFSKLSELSSSLDYKNAPLFEQFLKYKDKSSLLSAESDAKQISNPLKYSFWAKFSKKSFLGKTWSNTNLDNSDLANNTPLTNLTSKIQNNNLSYRFKDLKSGNLSYLTGERNVRLVDNVPTRKTNTNLTSTQNNLNALIQNNISNTISNASENLFLNSSLNWNNTSVLKQLSSTGTTFTQSHVPVQSNNPNWNNLGYTKYLNNDDDALPNLMKSKEESAPNYLFNAYWLTYWAHSSQSHRFSQMVNNLDTLKTSYIPLVTNYAEYDFKNWQTLELLEDAFWESTYSSFSHDEYLNILQSTKDYEYFKKQEELYNLSTRHKKFKSSLLAKPFFKDLASNINTSSLPIFSEDTTVNTSLLSTKNFDNFGNEISIDTLDDSYESSKNLNYLQYTNLKSSLSTNNNLINAMSYTQVMDNFRADYEENIWSGDNLNTDESLNYGTNTDYSFKNEVRSTNPLKLRSTTKNATVTYNAMQKVFRSRYDEGRSNARLQDLSNSFAAHPFITAPKSPYESLLGKNKESFFNINNYNQYFKANFNEMFSVWNSLNVYFADLPFLTSMKSDPSRYLWFDWQSRWSSIEIQPSSVARYSLLGVPYSTKSFEYSTSVGDEINDSENYLVRLARSRKNYITNWAYTPYFYSRVSNWYKVNSSTEDLFTESKLSTLKSSLKKASLYWTSNASSNNTTALTTPSYSGLNTSARSSWRPMSGVQSYNYTTSILVDILTKREHLYRQYFYTKGYTLNLPQYLTACPTNSLLREVKAAFPLIDPVSFSSEVSREFLYQNTTFLKFNLVREFASLATNTVNALPFNSTFLTNYTFFYLFGNNKSANLGKNLELYKNQYRPMKKGVTNMIRLHATGAIAMPIEIRLHILASSKDVIHSWAIPSAGIKIDCVPGYSSHRVAIFLVSGIFWGQCMEICGRFHHWMPIIVYFMKRDLFFLWCTHFMHYSSASNDFAMTDRQLADKVRLVSYDKMSWIKEINNIF